jgi:hypothetical protein
MAGHHDRYLCLGVALAWLSYFGVLEDWRHAMIAGLLTLLGLDALFNAYERAHHVHASRRALGAKSKVTPGRPRHQTVADDVGRRHG